MFFLHNNDFAYASRLQRVWFGQQCSCFDRSSNTFICHQYKVTVPVHTRSPLQLSWYEEDYVQPLAHINDLLCSFHALNIVNARALENANIAVIVGAIILRAVIYFALYWTLRQDTQALLRRQAAKSCVKDVPELTGKSNCYFHNVMASCKCQKPSSGNSSVSSYVRLKALAKL